MKNFQVILLVLLFSQILDQESFAFDDDVIVGQKVKLEVDIKYQVPSGWNDDPPVGINLNKDFTETPEAYYVLLDGPDITKTYWNDFGQPPPGVDTSQIQLGAPGTFYGDLERKLEIILKDDRLARVKVRVNSFSPELKTGYLYFSLNTYNLIVYVEPSNPSPNQRVSDIAPILRENKVLIECDKDYYFYVEAIDSGRTYTDPDIDPNFRLRAHFEPILPLIPSEDSIVADHIQIDVLDFDVHVMTNNQNTVQNYFNEIVEQASTLGSWVLVNDDFSKCVKDGEKYVPDNHKAARSKFELGGVRQTTIRSRSNHGGPVTITIPRGMTLWEHRQNTAQGGPTEYVPHKNSFRFDNLDSVGELFFLEGLEDGVDDHLRIRYKPSGSLEIGFNPLALYPGLTRIDDHSLIKTGMMKLMVDGDRDGEFKERDIRDRFLLFWTNDDTEFFNHLGVEDDLGDRGHDRDPEVIMNNPPDADDLRVRQFRDMEDLAGMKMEMSDQLRSLNRLELHDDGSTTSSQQKWRTVARTDMLDSKELEAGGHHINVYEWQGGGTSKEHVENPSDTFLGASGNFFRRVTPLNKPHDDFDTIGNANELHKKGKRTRVNLIYGGSEDQERYVFEARPLDTISMDGTNVDIRLETLITYSSTGTEFELKSPGVQLKLFPVAAFFDHYSIGKNDEEQEQLVKLDPDVTMYSNAKLINGGARVHEFGAKVHPDKEGCDLTEQFVYGIKDEQYLFNVHGWNNNWKDKQVASDTFYKRLYWQGYQGRVGSFWWPALVDDRDGPGDNELVNMTYNPSEFNAFRSGRAFANAIDSKSGSSKYGNKVHVFAHSMGNVVMAEAMRQLAFDDSDNSNMQVYIAANAALSAGIYGSDNIAVRKGSLAGGVDEVVFALGSSEDGSAEKKLNDPSTVADPWIKKLGFVGISKERRENIREVVFGLMQRWRMIRYSSDFYRYFAAGAPESEYGSGIMFWENVGVALGYGKFTDYSFFAGDQYYMRGTEHVATKKYNLFCEFDKALEAWNALMQLKGLIVYHPSWAFPYSSKLTTDGQWIFSRNDNEGFIDFERYKVLMGSVFLSNSIVFKIVYGTYEVHVFVNWFTGSFRNMFLKTGGKKLALGNSVGNNIAPGTNAYEVMAFLARPNAAAIGEHEAKLSGWTDINQVGLGNTQNQPGGTTRVNHSFFFYHNAKKTDKFFEKVEAVIGDESGENSTYEEGSN